MPLLVPCQNPSCDDEIKTYPSRLADGRDKFCSRSCYVATRTHTNRRFASDCDNVRSMELPETMWLCGVIDGEGHISISSKGYVRLVVANTCLPFLERITEVTGVGHLHPRKTYGQNDSPAWTWHVNGLTAIRLIEQMFPYLIVKADQAVAALSSPIYKFLEV